MSDASFEGMEGSPSADVFFFAGASSCSPELELDEPPEEERLRAEMAATSDADLPEERCA